MKKLFILTTLLSIMFVSCGKNVSGTIGIYDNEKDKVQSTSTIPPSYYTCSQQLYPQCVRQVSRNLLTGQYFYSTQCWNRYQGCIR